MALDGVSNLEFFELDVTAEGSLRGASSVASQHPSDIQTTIQTGGGASVGGSVTAGGAFIGRDQVIQGATPEQFADMLTRLLGLMVEIPQARNLLLGARTMLKDARLQLRRMAEYKEAHDLLQQLESSYGVISSLICDEQRAAAAGAGAVARPGTQL